MSSVKIDFNVLLNVVENNRTVQQKATEIAEKRLEVRKNKLINEFESHPVTEEISAGPGAENISNTLNDKGDLFSFFGFDKDEDPLFNLRRLLKTRLFGKSVLKNKRRNKSKKTITYIFEVGVLSQDQIEAATPVPWAEERSWAEAVENGSITNLGQYLALSRIKNETIREALEEYFEDYSRSGEGLQMKILRNKPVRDVRFKTINYIIKMVERLLIELQGKTFKR